MNKNTKIVLGLLIGIIVICLCTCAGGWLFMKVTGKVIEEKAVIDDPEEAVAFSQKMIDYDLLPGYQAESAVNMGIMKMVFLTEIDSANLANSRPAIVIAGMPISGEIDEEEMSLRIQLSVKKSMGRDGLQMHLVDEQNVEIRGQDVNLLIYEGTDENGATVKQIVSGLFEGKTGKVMFFIMGPEAGWIQVEIDGFIESIR